MNQSQQLQIHPALHFGAYRLDPKNEQLWRGGQVVRLTGKSFAVLRYLAGRPSQLVSKDELFENVWPATIVSDTTLTSCVKEVRKALADDAKTPRYIETVHRRGYRFIAPLTPTPPIVSGQSLVVSKQDPAIAPPLATGNRQLTTSLVGREAELAQLHHWLDKALSGERQIVFVTGEPGIGKTSVVEAFLAGIGQQGTGIGEQTTTARQRSRTDPRQEGLAAQSPMPDAFSPLPTARSLLPGPWIGRGQCIEQYGAGEAYMPVLEAFGRLCRGAKDEGLTKLLFHYAPTWLLQMPAVLGEVEMEALRRKMLGVGRERMLREMAEVIEALTAERALVLWLEDLHWSDYSTLELLAVLARRREPARLLLIGTYRPAETTVSEHSLRVVKQELQLHQYCQELALPPLSKEDVTDYLSMRFPGPPLPDVLGPTLHQRTDGNPLFMVNAVDSLVTQRVIVRQDGQWAFTGECGAEEFSTPESLRQMVEQQIERLSEEEQAVLEAASVVGREFATATVAAVMEGEAGQVEGWCEKLARRGQFLSALGMGEWPDGTLAARYGFTHALYRDVVYDRLRAVQRVRLHQRIGAWEEEAYGNRANERAAELAVHFERGRDFQRAVNYLHQAALNATQRYAYTEGITLLTKGLELLNTLPDTVERASQELILQLGLGMGLVLTKGPAAPEVGAAYTRARELCRQVGDTLLLFPVLWGLRVFHLVRAELHTAQELGEQALRFAQQLDSEALLLQAHMGLGMTLYYQGELTTARTHFARGAALYDPHRDNRDQTRVFARVGCLSYEALILWLLGYPDQALKRNDESVTLAQERSYPFGLAYAQNHAAMLHQFRGEGQAAQQHAEAATVLSQRQGFPLGEAMGVSMLGHALAGQGQVQEGIAHMRQGLAAHQALGVQLGVPSFLALLAEASVKAGQGEEGLRILSEALAAVQQSEEHFYEAEIYRLKGEMTLVQSRAQHLTSRVQTNQKANGKWQMAKTPSIQHLSPTPKRVSQHHRACPPPDPGRC